MSTYINFSIKTRTEFQDWILVKLGHPLVTVELTEDQLNVAINDALEYFTEYSDAQENYVLLNLEDYEEDIGISLSAHNVKSIFSMDEEYGSHGINTLFSIENQMANAGILPMNFGASGSLVSYELACQFMDLTKRMMCKKFDFNFDVRNQRLKLWPDPKAQSMNGYVILGVKTVPSEEELFGEHYVKKLALAAAKMMLGVIRAKFAGIQLPGGGTIDTSIGDEGKIEWDKFTDEVVKWIGPHNGWYIG